MFLDSSVADCVFPTTGRNYPADFAGNSVARQIPLIHHDSGFVIDMDNRVRSQRPLPVSTSLALIFKLAFCNCILLCNKCIFQLPSTFLFLNSIGECIIKARQSH